MGLSDEEMEEANKMFEKKEDVLDKFVDWLESQEHVYNVRDGTYSIDFTIGDITDDWPSSFKDDEIKAIHRSSVAKQGAGVRPNMRGEFVSDAVIHLPPAEEGMEDEIVEAMDLGSEFMIHFGSRKLGGLAAPDGVLTPHIHLEDDAEVTPVQFVVSKALSVYEDVYQCGELAIKKQP